MYIQHFVCNISEKKYICMFMKTKYSKNKRSMFFIRKSHVVSYIQVSLNKFICIKVHAKVYLP